MIGRDQALAAFEADAFDVVVIGGGITGAGVALDAASRGYSVALVEKSDFAAGTSSRSSKLVHGGLRYLQQFDIGLVREALLERAINVKLAPHLVKPLPMVVASFGGKRPDRLLGVGLNMYDAMAVETLRRRVGRRGKDKEGDAGLDLADWSPDRHRIIPGEEVLEHIPALAAKQPSGGYLFYDCQTDDVRLVLTILGEAERFGAVIANGCEVDGLLSEDDRASGVRLTDGREIRATNVINATGVWADLLEPGPLHDESDAPTIHPSRGTHVTLHSDDLPLRSGAIVPAGKGRSIFALPWLGRTLIGTTDNDYEGPLDHIKPSVDDVHYLLDATNEFFGTSLGPANLTGAYAGVRPLISTGDPKKSVDISRRAELYETRSGLVTITGGKLTTWRRMAKMAVDRIVEREGREAECRTAELQLGMPVELSDLPAVEGVDDETNAMLAGRYGFAAKDVLALAAERPELARRVVPDLPDLVAEAPFSVRREQASSLADVLLRRTRLGLLAARALTAEDSAPARAVAEALAPELGWDGAQIERELAAWREVAAAEGIALTGEPAAAG